MPMQPVLCCRPDRHTLLQDCCGRHMSAMHGTPAVAVSPAALLCCLLPCRLAGCSAGAGSAQGGPRLLLLALVLPGAAAAGGDLPEQAARHPRGAGCRGAGGQAQEGGTAGVLFHGVAHPGAAMERGRWGRKRCLLAARRAPRQCLGLSEHWDLAALSCVSHYHNSNPLAKTVLLFHLVPP